MRYAFLDYVACQHCQGPLTCVTAREVDAPVPAGPFAAATRASGGPGVGVPPDPVAGDVGMLLARLAGPRADPSRNLSVEVADGLLVCGRCGRWYPIHDRIPEVLPDHLRDRERKARCSPWRRQTRRTS